MKGCDPSRHYVRDFRSTVVSTSDGLTIYVPGAPPRTLACDDVTAAAEFWQTMVVPVSGADLEESATRLKLTSFVESLIEIGAVRPVDSLVAATLDHAQGNGEKPCGRMVLGVSGSAQTIFVANYVQKLIERFTEDLDVILTESATHLVTPRSIALLGAKVWTDVWGDETVGRVPHIELARSAELVLVLPATASAISRIANGQCSDLLSLVATATAAPVVVAPSMNPAMWASASVKRNVQQLRDDGRFVIEPGPGFEVEDGPTGERCVGAAGVLPVGKHLLEVLAAVMSNRRS